MILAGKAEVDRVKGEGGGLEKYKNARGCYDNFFGSPLMLLLWGKQNQDIPK